MCDAMIAACVGARGVPCRPACVDFDGGQGPPESLQRQSKDSVAGTDLGDGPVGARDDPDDGVDDEAIVKEVLTDSCRSEQP
jgi:hypothetical protein